MAHQTPPLVGGLNRLKESNISSKCIKMSYIIDTLIKEKPFGQFMFTYTYGLLYLPTFSEV